VRAGCPDITAASAAYRDLLRIRTSEKAFSLPGTPYHLHPVQATGSDETTKTASYNTGSGTFTVPARTVAVFTRAGN
jgi:hypothetical protein